MTTNGVKFPLAINTAKGDLVLVSDANLYKSHIMTWLSTVPLERVMRLNYGLKDYLFETIPDVSVITTFIREGLIEYVPDVTIEDVEGSINDAGEVVINVYWSYLDEEQSTLQLTL